MELTNVKEGLTKQEITPSDWYFSKIGDLAEIATGTTPPTSDKSNYGNEFLFVSPADLGSQKWINRTEKKLSQKGFTIARKYPKHSILFTCIGSTIGKSGIASIELTSNQQINAVFPNEKFDSEYVYYALARISKEIKSQAGEQAVPMVNKSEFSEFKILIPSTLAEQKAIATALSDVDDLISNLDKLISKKKAIKQGAMQQLLTPPHKSGNRLAGFSGEWEEKKLGDIGECIIGLTYNPSNVVNSGTLVLRSSNIQDDQLSFKDNVYVNSNIPEKLRVRKGDILVCVRNGSRRLIGKCAKIDERCEGETFGAFMSIYRSQLNDFISHAFKGFSIQKQIEENLGATINQITNSTLNSFKVWLPTDEKERIAIVNILDDMDVEIVQLQDKMAKYQLIKQGMMQELLTGKTRLI